MMNGTIYKIQNKIDGKIYIGQTISDLHKRLYLHQYPKSRCLYLKNAIAKFGIKSFEITEIEIINRSTKNELYDVLDILEKEYIKKFDCMFPNGYNLTDGGRRARMSDDAIKRRANSCKKSIICNETGKIYASATDAANEFGVKPKFISRVLRGERKHFRGASFSYVDNNGKPVTPKIKRIREKSSYNLKGLFNKIESRKRSIICNETGQTWNSIREAADSFGAKNEAIHRVLRGKRKRFRRLTFSYLHKQS